MTRPLILLCAGLVLALGIVVALRAPAEERLLDVGSPGDAAYVSGFNAPEVNSHETYRWSQETAGMEIPVPEAGRYRVLLGMATARPGDRVLQIDCGTTPHLIRIADHPGNSELTLDCVASGTRLGMTLKVPTFSPAGDARDLGASVRYVRVDPVSSVWDVSRRGAVLAAVVCSLVGVSLAAGGLQWRRLPVGLATVVAAGWALAAMIQPDWLVAAAAGPDALLVLAGGIVTLLLALGRIVTARVAALVAPLAVVLIDQPRTALLLDARWTGGDDGALQLLPWLAAGAIALSAVRGRRDDRYLAATGAALGLIGVVLPLLPATLSERWSLTLAVPDWTDRAAIAGAVYLAAIVLVTVVGIITTRRHSVWPVLPVVGLALCALVGWRAVVMDLNGDEPHYYVMARSIGADLDLELLSNYHEPSYREATISPDGNIAVQRDTTSDRYAALTPPPSGSTTTGSMMYGGLPRDRYASKHAFVEVVLHNAGSDPASAVVVLRGETADRVQDVSIEVRPKESEQLHLETSGYETLWVQSDPALRVETTARVWAGEYALPLLQPLNRWDVPVAAAEGRDAGVWLSLTNRGVNRASVGLADGGKRELIDLCAGCSRTVLLESGAFERTVHVDREAGDVSVAAVVYEERTGSLHFDPGLPSLAAPMARIGPPKLVLAVPVLAAVALAGGVTVLLRRSGVDGRLAQLAVAGVTLLAPVSAYAVRFYTEIVAAALLVWALVCWDVARRDARYLLPLGALALVFPILHGRYVVFSVVLGLLILTELVTLLRAASRRVLIVAGIALLVAVPLTAGMFRASTGLQERVNSAYIATNWADVGLAGVLLDRGSGLIPYAPWVLLAWFVPRPLQPLQRIAIAIVFVQLAAVIVRAGGWQTWGAPSRYLLPAVPLLVVLVAPAIPRLWSNRWGRSMVVVAGAWSVASTFLLHWLPLAGYVRGGRYLVDEAWQGLAGASPQAIFPTITPAPGSFIVGTLLTFGLLIVALWQLVGQERFRVPNHGSVEMSPGSVEAPERGASTGGDG